jgi:hypothetical protein
MQQLKLEHSRRSSIHDPVAIRNAFGPAFEEEHAEWGDVLHIYLNFSKGRRHFRPSFEDERFIVLMGSSLAVVGKLKFAAAR